MSDPIPIESTTLGRTISDSPTRLLSRRFLAAIVSLGAVQLMAQMDGSIAIVGLAKIQNELGLSDAGRSWVINGYVLTYGGLLLVGGRLGDTIGLKRTFIGGVTLFSIASAVCGFAHDGTTLVGARLLQGVAGAVLAPTSIALAATTFPKGPARNAAVAVFGAMASLSSVMSLVVGGALTGLSWRLVFLVNAPIGLLAIYLARTALRETERQRMKLDVAGAVLATVTCISAVVAVSMAPEKGWLSGPAVGFGAVALGAFVAFIIVERNAENPIVPFDLFFDRSRVATFATVFLSGGVLLTLSVMVTLFVQNIMGFSALRASVAFIPFVLAVGTGVVVSSRLVARFPPRLLVLAGGLLVLGAMLYCSTLHYGIQYFPSLVAPLVVGGIGLGVASVPVELSVIASVGPDRIGPTSAISLVLFSLGGPVVLSIIQAVATSRTVSLGGTNGPAKSMSPAQLHALDQGYTYGLLWLAGVSVLVGVAALFIGYTAQQIAQAQEVKKAMDTGDL
ncbi:MAG: MFS transporter [Actinomycetota bacterium]|nr:MFS transporter [Actinomycetota bacterium]